MTFKEAIDEYWKYYISLEEQFVETRRYVEFDYIHNGRVYSIEYLMLFQAVCSEIDVVGKSLARIVDSSFSPTKNTGINEWWFYLSNDDSLLELKKCSLFGEYDIQPWKNFGVTINTKPNAKKYILDEKRTPKAKTPSWWTDYNSVKHNRTGHYQKNLTNYAKANLRNLFYAFAALFILEEKLMNKIKKNSNDRVPTDLESKLFSNDVSLYTTVLRIG